MAKGKSTWKYNKLLTARRNYFDTGGSFLGLDWSNPFKGADGATAKNAVTSAVGAAVGGIGGGLLSGGMTSTAGNVLSGLSSIAGAIPGPWGAVASAGLGLLGGFTNRVLGSKLNTKNIAQVEANINSLNNFQSDASDFDTLSQTWGNTAMGTNFANSYIGKDGWLSSKAKNKAKALRTQMEQANARAQSALENNANNIELQQADMLEQNYAAYGGPLLFSDGGSIHIKPENRGKFTETKRRTGKTTKEEINPGLDAMVKARLALDSHFGNSTARRMTNYDTRSYTFPDGRRGNVYVGSYGNYVTPQIQDVDGELKFIEDPWSKENRERSKAQSMKFESPRDAEYFAKNYKRFAPMMSLYSKGGIIQNARKWHHAFGGELNTQGGDFTNGLLYIDNGGSHEANPYEGVLLGVDPEGTPNLVEEGETVFNDYVFSKRLKVPKAIREKYKLRGTKNLTFAEVSKKMAKESEERPNDPISMRGLEALMFDLANAQEELKAEKRQNSYAYGGKVNKFAGDNPWTPSQINSYGYIKDGYYGLGDTPFWIKDGNYTDSYKDFINTKYSINDFRQHLKDQFKFYDNATGKDKESNRYKAIEYFVKANPDWYNHRGSVDTWNIDDALMSKAKQYALSKPGFMHPEKVAEAYLSKQNTPAAEKKAAVKKNRYLEYGTGNALDYFEGRDKVGKSWFDLHPGYSFVDKKGTVRDPVDEKGVSTIYTDYFLKKAEAENPKEEEEDPKYKKLPTGLRYTPAIGLGLAALTDAFGLTNKPDYGNAEAVLEASKGAGIYQPVKFNPIGNYLIYRPFDRDRYINKMNAEAGAARRSLLNTSGGNRATAMAGILAADNNYLNQIGDLSRQAEEYNLAQRQQVEDFNRATNTTNSQGFLQADMANQKALMDSRGLTLKGTMSAAEMRERARLAAEQAKSANLSGFVTALGDIGRENMAWNWRNFGLATDSFGHVGDEQDLLTHTGKERDNKRAKGGKIKRRKGLTL